MNNNIQSLVEEAYDKIRKCNPDWLDILTDLATRASQNGLQPLPESPTEDFIFLIRGAYSAGQIWEYVIKHFGTPPAEWWMGLEKGDKFLEKDNILAFSGEIYLKAISGDMCNVSQCSPYTEPTALEQFMQSLTPEQRELAKSLTIQEGGG